MFLPFVVERSQENFCFFGKIFEISCSHNGNFPLHFGCQHYILDKIRDAVNCRFKVVDSGGFRLIENFKGLGDSKID